MEAAGIEPASEINASNLPAVSCDNTQVPSAANALQHAGTSCRSEAPIDAALHKVIAAWNSLPHNIQQAIVMLADSQFSSGP